MKHINEEELTRRIAALSEEQKAGIIFDVVTNLYGEFSEDESQFLYTGLACDTGEELDIVLCMDVLRNLATP